MIEEETSPQAEPAQTLFRAKTLVSHAGQQYGDNQHFYANPMHVKPLLESGQIEAVADQ